MLIDRHDYLDMEREREIRRKAEEADYAIDDVIMLICKMQELFDSVEEVWKLDRLVTVLHDVQGELQKYE